MAQRQLSSGEKFVREYSSEVDSSITILRGHTFKHRHNEPLNEREWITTDVAIPLDDAR